MSYVISVCENNINYCIRADEKTNRFVLIPVESDSSLSKVLCHPYRNGARQILNWINANDAELASKNLQVSPEAMFRK